MMLWRMLHPNMTPEALGFIPSFLNDEDPRLAREQLDQNYRFAGGWEPFLGFDMLSDGSLKYPGDPPLPPLAETKLHNKETIRFYQHCWVAIIQPNGDFEISKMD